MAQSKLSVLNPFPKLLPGPGLLHHLLDRHATSKECALEFLALGGRRECYSYGTLHAAASAFAASIFAALQQVRPSHGSPTPIIPVLLPQCPELYVTLLAILKAGAAFCPLSLDAPLDRLRYLIGDVNGLVVVTSSALRGKVEWENGPDIVVVDDTIFGCPGTTSPPAKALMYTARPESTAYVMYTSGSTGTPKGVQVSHLAVTQSLLAQETHIPHSCRFLQFAALTFDVSVFEIFFTLYRGSTLIACNRVDLLSNLPAVINKMGIDGAELTPTVVSSLLKTRKNVPGLKVLLTIGEILSRPVVKEFGGSAECPGILHGMYGPTEAAVQCTIAGGMLSDSPVSNIGIPFSTVTALILAPIASDPDQIMDMEALPLGEVGELAIGGYQVADGYLNRPEQTSLAFIASQKYGRYYRTGDKARIMPDGSIDFLGRMDSRQIKLRGQRIELGEIEQAIYRIEGVFNATAAVVDSILVTFCVTEPRVTATQVLESCRQWLPSYMIPSDIILLQDAPRLPSGKVDTKQLVSTYEESKKIQYAYENEPKSEVEHESSEILDEELGVCVRRANILSSLGFDSQKEVSDHQVELDKEYGQKGENAEWTTLEKEIAELVSAIIGCQLGKIDRHTSFFRLGLDSLSAISLSQQLRDHGYNGVDVFSVLDNPTVGQLARFASAQPADVFGEKALFDVEGFDKKFRTKTCTLFDLKEQDVESIWPCTAIQAGMIAQFLHSEGSMYCNGLEMKLERSAGSLQNIEMAWKAVFMKYQMLRTGFAPVNDSEFQFAMITYSVDAADLPCEALTDSIGTCVGLREQAKRCTASIMRSLHRPAWRLVTIPSKSQIIVQFFAHHALYDGESLHLILDDVGRAYTNVVLPLAVPVAPALGEILRRSLDQTDDTRRFWHKTGKDMAIRRFPDLNPLQVSSDATNTVSRICALSLIDFEGMCKKEEVTMLAAGQAAWARLLSAYLGDSTVTFGTVFSGRRNLYSAQDAVFPTITSLPISARIGAENGLNEGRNKDLLNQMMAKNLDITKHQFTPLSKISQWSGHQHEFLFDTLFAYQKTFDSTFERSWPWVVVDEKATAEYVISMEIIPTNLSDGVGSLKLQITAREDRVPRQASELLLAQFEVTLIDTLSNSNSVASEFTSLPSNLLAITPASLSKIPSEVTYLHGFVELQTQKIPHKIAFEFATAFKGERVIKEKWTYAQLNEEGEKIASLLRSRSIGPGNLISTCFNKCPEASFAILGILKAGCAYVAIDPGSPPERRNFIIADSRAIVLFTTKDLSEAFQSVSIPVIALDDRQTKASISSQIPGLGPSDQVFAPSSICYCIYTSGTTGTPKGCMISHENAVQFMLAFQRVFKGHWDTNSRFLQFASFHFDVSVMEQYWSWSVGICVTSAPRDLIFEDIAAAIRRLKITHIDLTPSLAKKLCPEEVPMLSKGVFITGGEQLQREIINKWGPKNCIYNGYGPSEATIGVTMYPRVPENGKPSNIGPQFDNVGSFVLNPNGNNPVLRGAVGELCVSGTLVGQGYLNLPEMTEKAFPILENFEERVYRTGDIVRILHDGSFDFLGRADDQVKLRGQRLEIGEINEVIKGNVSDIQEVETLVLKHPNQMKEQLVSFFVPSLQIPLHSSLQLLSGTFPKKLVAAAQDACHAKLPGYMVPTHFLPLTRIPLSVNNKTDYKKLKTFYSNLSTETLHELTSSWNGLWDHSSEKGEIILQAICEATGLKPDAIGKGSNIFNLGLDSISVIGFARKLRQRGLIEAQNSTIIQSKFHLRIWALISSLKSIDPIISSLMAALTESPKTGIRRNFDQMSAQHNINAYSKKYLPSFSKTLEVAVDSIESIAPCTPLQEGIISRSLRSEEPLYFNMVRLELPSTTDLKMLQNAWKTVYLATQVLRTKFLQKNDGFAQVVMRRPHLPWYKHEFATMTALEKYESKAFTDWWRANRAFTKSCFELHLLQSPVQRVLCIYIVHALYDGTSLRMILRDVASEYQSLPSMVRPKFHDALSFGPLMKAKGAKEFWKEAMEVNKYAAIPHLTGYPAYGTVTSSLAIPLDVIDRIRRSHSVTHQSLIQAAWCVVFQRRFHIPAAMGLVVSGRNIHLEDAEEIAGPLFNTIPFYIKITSKSSWDDIIKKCHAFNTRAVPFQHTALRDITKWCKRSPEEPLMDSLFVFQKEADDWGRKYHLWKEVEAAPQAAPQADYPISFEAVYNPDSSTPYLRLNIVAQRLILNETIAAELLGEIDVALRDIELDAKALCLGANVLIEASPVEKDPGAGQDGSQSKHGIVWDAYSARAPSFQVDELYEWSHQAKQIRDQLANIAGLDVSLVKPFSSIFELGLDSLDVIKLTSRLRTIGIELPVSYVMHSPTVSAMAQKIAVESSRGERILSVEKNGNDLGEHEKSLWAYLKDTDQLPPYTTCVLPVTPLQEAMIAEMVASKGARYFNHEVMALHSSTDASELEAQWCNVISQSPILRTSFIEIDDPHIDATYAQVVCDSVGTTFDVIFAADYGSRDGAVQEAMYRSREELAEGKYFKLTLIDDKESKLLLLSMAHALYDGWSQELLHDDVRLSYVAKYSPRPGYGSVLADILNSAGPTAEKYWKGTLFGVESCCLSSELDNNDLSARVHRRERISSFSSERLIVFCKSQAVTVQTIGLTCWALVLAQHLKMLDVVFGTVLFGRDTEKAQNVLFPTMNTVAVRSILHGSIEELLQYMQDQNADTLEYQHFPLRRAKALVGHSGRRLFDSLFIYQRRPPLRSEGELLYESVGGSAEVEYPVCVELEIVGDIVVWRTACKSFIFDGDGAEELLMQMESVLDRILKSPEEPTIDFTSDGLSICGQLAFELQQVESVADSVAPSETLDSSIAVGEWLSTESTIRSVLSKVSGVAEQEISKTQTIFHLGLDSISAIKVSALLRKQSIQISVSDILKAATIVNIALLVDDSLFAITDSERATPNLFPDGLPCEHLIDEACETLNMKHDAVESVLPATAGQVYMLSMWQHSRGALFYPTFRYFTANSMDKDRLAAAWVALCKENSILRTLFAATGRSRVPFVQIIENFMGAEEKSVMWASDERSLHQDLVRAVTSSGNKDGLVFLGACKLDGELYDGTILHLRIHHALYDGVSLPLLVRRLEELYNNPESHPFSNVAIQRFISYLIGSSTPPQCQDFWQTYLQNCINTRTMLADRGSPLSYVRSRARKILFVSSLSPSMPVADIAKSAGLSVQSVLIAVYARAHCTLLHPSPTNDKDPDFVLGIYLAQRSLPIPELQKLVAPTMNILPLRIREPRSTPLLKSAARVQQDLLVIAEARHARVGLWEILEWTGIKLDCTLNILSLPEMEPNPRYPSHDKVVLEQTRDWGADSDWEEPVWEEGDEPGWIKKNKVRAAYGPTIDIEMAVRSQGIDVGIFLPRLVEGSENTEALMEELKETLERVQEL